MDLDFCANLDVSMESYYSCPVNLCSYCTYIFVVQLVRDISPQLTFLSEGDRRVLGTERPRQFTPCVYILFAFSGGVHPSRVSL